jgi:hypothetical protein
LGNAKSKGKVFFVLSRFLVAIGKTLRSLFNLRVKGGLGRRDNPDDGAVSAGVTVPLKQPPPVLVGKEAKSIPTGDDDSSRHDLAA